jgi:phage-related protein
MQKFAKLAGKEGGVIAEEMASTAQQTIKANKLNISMRGLMQAVGKQSAIVKLNSKGSATQMVKQVAQAKALGLEMSKVEAIASGMLDLESSLAAEMEAELLTGKELNLEKAREAALNNDNATLMEEIKNQFGSIEEFQDMNRVQQEAFGKAVGLSRDGLAEMLVTSKENEATNTDMVSTQDKSLAAMQSMASVAEGLQASEEGRQAAFSKIFTLLNPIVELFKDLQPLIMEIIEPIVEFLAPVLKEIMEKILPFIKSIFASLKPIIESLLVAIMPIVDVLMGVMDTVLPIISKLFQMLAPIIVKIVEAVAPFIKKLSDIALKLLPIITKIFNKLTPVIEKILKAIMPIFDIIADLAESLLPVVEELFDALLPVVIKLVDALLPIVEIFGDLIVKLIPSLLNMLKLIKPILDPILGIFSGVADVITGILEGDFSKIGEGLKTIAQGLMNLVIGLLESIINLPIAGVNNMLAILPGDTQIPKVEFGRVELAEGGIVNSPTNALIGEAGPEAVVPLNDDKSMNVFSKSLEAKLDMLISAVQQGGNVYIDGEKAGTALVMGNYKLQ